MRVCVASIEGISAILLLMIGGISSSIRQSGYRYRNKGMEEIITNPYFTSQSAQYQAEIGKDVTLYCAVENIGTSTLIWKKENRIISAGKIIIRKDNRFSLSGYNLTIHHVDMKDEGDYVCEVETYNDPISQVNTLGILIPPEVTPLPEDGKYTVRKGSTLSLECRATGNPKPIITWRKKGISRIPVFAPGRNIGEAVFLDSIGRHHTGVYECTADNNVGSNASAEIKVTVLYPPEISISRDWRPNPYHLELQITCTIHAEPLPVVRWYKDSMLLDPTHNKLMESKRNRHTLTVKRMGVTDYGNYSCMAENSIGKDRGYIQISGQPLTPEIISSRVSTKSKEYTLEWKTYSILSIREYRVLFRQKKVSPNVIRLDGSLATPKPTRANLQEMEWTNIIPTTQDGSHSQHGKHHRASILFLENFTFFSLTPNTEYEVMVQAHNVEGWSETSPIFTFSTPSQDYEPQHYFFSSAAARPVSGADIGLLLLASLSSLWWRL